VAEKKKIDPIKSKIIVELSKIFGNLKIFFIGEKQADSRFNYFLSNTDTIYIPDIKEPGSVPNEMYYKYYMENIYTTDYQLKSGGLISEITIPFLYKKQMPFGYIQINSTQTLPPSMASQLKTYASRIELIFDRSGIFKHSTERFIVIDVSQGGFAIAFRDKKFLRLFQQNVSMCIRMLLVDKDVDMFVAPKHITPDSRMITVGFQILKIEEPEVYEEFLRSLS